MILHYSGVWLFIDEENTPLADRCFAISLVEWEQLSLLHPSAAKVALKIKKQTNGLII